MLHDRRAHLLAASVDRDDLLRQTSSRRISTRSVPVWGTSSAGLNTTAFPHTSAGNIFQVGMALGS